MEPSASVAASGRARRLSSTSSGSTRQQDKQEGYAGTGRRTKKIPAMFVGWMCDRWSFSALWRTVRGLLYAVNTLWKSPSWRAGLRSIGLHVVAFLGYPGEEEPRVIVDKSLWRALARCSVHILPVLCEIVLIWVNLYGVLYGTATALRLALMQVTAKVMELLAVGSLATIVWQVMRTKLLRSSGLPFGLLGAGVNFTQINWFWSPAFVFSLGSWDQWFVVLTVLLCGGLALVRLPMGKRAMGPATAVLLVPVQWDNWVGGSTKFWMNGTAASLWPERVTGDHVGWPDCRNTSTLQYDDLDKAGCAWVGYPLLRNSFQFLTNKTMNTLTLNDILPGRTLQGQMRNFAYGQWNTQYGLQPCETFTYAPHVVETTLSNDFEHMWQTAVAGGGTFLRSHLRYAYPYQTSVPTRISAVRTRCELQTIYPGNTTIQFSFPALPEYKYFSWTYWTWNGTLNLTEANGTYVTTRWIPLSETEPPPQDPDETPPSAAVLISLASYSRLHNTPLLYVLPCSVDARWAQGFNLRDTTLQGRGPHYGMPLHTLDHGGCLNPFPPAPDGTWRHINFDQDYLSWLAPSLSGGPSSELHFQRTTLADILDNAVSVQSQSQSNFTDQSDFSARAVEMILAHFFAEALSRMGLADNANLWYDEGHPNPGFPKYEYDLLHGKTVMTKPTFKDSLETEWKMDNTAFVIKARSVTDYLSIVVLCVHILLALAHTAWILSTRETSDSWDGIDELLALVWNSEPLRGAPSNTCGGINDRQTLSSKVKIRVVDPTPGEGTESVQLVAADSSDHLKEVEVNVAYGAS